MEMYDTIVVGEKEGQVKIWEELLTTYEEGSKVPSFSLHQTYSIAMREGGFVNIEHCILKSWTDEPAFQPVFDKWGGYWHGHHKTMPYFYVEPSREAG